MSPDAAETLALSALAWLLAEDELLPVFMGASGASEADLRSQATEPEFLAAVMDFILMNDAWVLSCAEAIGAAPEGFLRARQLLPGGALPGWT
jgi:hypothetical protein